MSCQGTPTMPASRTSSGERPPAKSGFGAGGRAGLTGAEAGVYGWAGAAGTVAMVDTVHGTRSAIYAQFMPPNAVPLLGEFQHALRADLMALADRAREHAR